MKPMPLLPVVIGSLLGLLAGCSMLSMDQEPGRPADPEENRSELHGRLLQIAGTYEQYGRVDDELRWAPYLCRQPQPSRARLSASDHLDSHGRKLYFLFAADREAYLARNGKDPAVAGQVLVKEAWEVQEVPPDTAYNDRETPVRYLRQDGKLYHAARRAGLFILYRADPGAKDTDEGWLYGTIGGDGGTVTSAGRVGSCMGCHRQAPKGRLFGIAYNGA